MSKPNERKANGGVATLALVYLAAANAAGFFLMAWDKRQAARAGRRVPESRLLGAAAVGGSVGVYAGMRLLRHKTLHPKFAWGVPMLIAAQAAAVILAYRAV